MECIIPEEERRKKAYKRFIKEYAGNPYKLKCKFYDQLDESDKIELDRFIALFDYKEAREIAPLDATLTSYYTPEEAQRAIHEYNSWLRKLAKKMFLGCEKSINGFEPLKNKRKKLSLLHLSMPPQEMFGFEEKDVKSAVQGLLEEIDEEIQYIRQELGSCLGDDFLKGEILGLKNAKELIKKWFADVVENEN